MNEYIESSTILSKRLGTHLDKIKKLDPLPKERRRTTRIKEILIKSYGTKCAYCNTGYRPQAAHIIPLEIGATTEKRDIILLCKNCHTLYDKGYKSITFMSEFALKWQSRTLPNRPRKPLKEVQQPKPTMTSPPSSVKNLLNTIVQMQRELKYAKATELIDENLNDPNICHDGHIYLQIKRAELARRRSGHSQMDIALKALKKIELKEVPRIYQPVYYYEFGYANRLLGHHSEAAKLMQLSAKVSLKLSKGKPKADYVAALANVILCEMAASEKPSKKKGKEFIERFSELEDISKSQGTYWGKRWETSCAAHALQVHLKVGNKNECWSQLKHAKELYYDLDIKTGWDAGGRQTLSMLDGLVRVLHPKSDKDIKKGTEFLARSFVSRLGNKQRPENLRDVG
ncbi:MAG: HNH endonuclease signature motif containing protein, partial [Thermodesulfobacteriota bacterium]